MAKTLFEALIYFLEMLIAFTFFTRAYDKRIKNSFIIILIGSALFIPSSFIFLIYNNEIINLSLFFVINFIFSLLCFRVSIKESIILNVFLDAIMFASELLIIFLLSSIFDFPANLYKENFLIFVIVSIISKILYLAFSQLLFLFKKDTINNSRTKQFIPLFIFPILSIVTLLIILMIELKSDLSRQLQIAVFVISVLNILACIFVFVYYQMLSEKEAKVKELENEQQFYNLNNAYLEVLQHQNDELQMHFHDTKNHYITLSGFDTIDEVKDYISNIYPDLESKTIVNVSSNRIINLIISKYIVICKKQGIKLSYELQTANLNYIADSELSIILNNIMDNAVEAASQSEEKLIELSIRHINDMDLLSVINSCDTPPNVKGNRLITTKKDSNGHGFGTKIIKKHAALNNATYEWFYDEDEKQFHTYLIFNPNKP